MLETFAASAATILNGTRLFSATNLFAHDGPWDGPGWWVIFPLLWFALIAFVVFGIFFRGRRYGRWSAARSGEARLAERFAAGEIDENEYRRRLEILKDAR